VSGFPAVIAVSVVDEATGEVIHAARIDERSPTVGEITITWDKRGSLQMRVEEVTP
jgi:hypothetical protein